MVLDEVHDAVKAAMDGAPVVVRAAEILTPRALLVMGNVDCVANELVYALVAHGRNGNDRDAQHVFHLVDANRAAVTLHLVHHVQSEHHRHVELHELHRQVQVPLDVGGVDDVYDGARFLFEDELARNDFLARVRRHRVNAGQIDDIRQRLVFDLPFLAVDRHARKVPNMLVRSG